jgi:hypothetical protein
MAGTLQAGTRVAYNTTATATLTAAAALAALPSGWTMVANIISVEDVVRANTQDFDDSSLDSTAPVPNVEYRPGSGGFTKKKNSQSVALATLSANATPVAVAYVYADGTADVAQNCLIICTSGAKATKGNFQDKVPEAYRRVPQTTFVYQDHA